jgi:hypothetical protein
VLGARLAQPVEPGLEQAARGLVPAVLEAQLAQFRLVAAQGLVGVLLGRQAQAALQRQLALAVARPGHFAPLLARP